MAIKSKKLKLSYDGGLVEGKQKKYYKTYSSINLEAADEKVKTAGDLLADLQSYPVLEMVKIEESSL